MTTSVTVPEIVLFRCHSTIFGYNVRDEVIKAIRDLTLSKPLLIPCQSARRITFPQHATSGGLSCSTGASLRNCCNLTILFPRYNEEISVSKNPGMRDFSINVDNIPTPSISVSTYSASHTHLMITNAELNDLFEANEEMTHSLTFEEFVRNPTPTSTSQVISKPTYRDNTSYWANFSLERLTVGSFIDGYNSGGAGSKIELTGSAIVDGFGNRYMYQLLSNPTQTNTSAPVIVVWEDFFMSCQPGRVQIIREIPKVLTGQNP